MTIINDTENTIHKLIPEIQDITTELKAIKMFVKEQFYLIKKSSTEIENQCEPQRNKQFIELSNNKIYNKTIQQNKNPEEEKK